MRYAPDHKDKTRAKILKASAKVFRRLGYHASGVDSVMAEAGLTAGGFYAHFASKEELLAEALTRAAEDSAGTIVSGAIEGLAGRDWIEAFLDRYLTRSHMLDVEQGCPMAALVSEIARSGAPVKSSFEGLVRELAGQIVSKDSGDERGATLDRALALISLCVGGLCLSRAVADQSLAGMILDSCRTSAKGLFSKAPSFASARKTKPSLQLAGRKALSRGKRVKS